MLDFLIELIFDGIVDGWFFLMEWIVPEKIKNKKLQSVLKVICCCFSLVLFLSMMFGIIAMINPDPYTHKVGQYLFFVPLAISILQILLGIMAKCVRKRK